MSALTRFDRNVAENILDFSYYQRDSELVKDLVFFFAHDFQHKICSEDLWGRKILDPEQFALTVGRDNYRSLLNKHPEPQQFLEKKFKDMSPEQLEEVKRLAKTENGEPLYDGWLDNALYRCRYDMLKFSKKGKTPTGHTTSELGEIRFLKYLKKFFHPKTKKIYYEIEADETFINDLARYFLKFDFQVYKSLGKPSFQDFYIALITIRDRHNTENMPTIQVVPYPPKGPLEKLSPFDYLCLLAKTNCTKPEDRKKHINKAVKEISQLHGSSFVAIKWERNGQHNFRPVLHFTLSEKELLEKSNEAKTRYRHYTIVNLKAKFREQFAVLLTNEIQYKQEFIRWLKTPEWMFEVKHSVVLKTYLQCFGSMPKNKKTGEEDPYDANVMNYIKVEIPEMADSAIFENASYSAPKPLI